jgi:hypothetical protein
MLLQAQDSQVIIIPAAAGLAAIIMEVLAATAALELLLFAGKLTI